MEIKTDSGYVRVNKKSHYGKWLKGYTDANGWSGHNTLRETWAKAEKIKPAGCTWETWGQICGLINFYKHKNN